MAKKERMPSYLAAKELIKKGFYSQSAFDKYKENRQLIQARNLKERGKELQSEREYRRSREKYDKGTVAGRFSGLLTKGFQTASQRGGVARALYRQQGQLPPTNVQNRFQTIQGTKTNRRGRPTGTLDKRYAAYGGVYGYRKAMALERFKQRQMILQSRAVSPQQQAILNQIRSREQYQRSNMEGQIIPNTQGDVFLDGIMDEITRASNAVN